MSVTSRPGLAELLHLLVNMLSISVDDVLPNRVGLVIRGAKELAYKQLINVAVPSWTLCLSRFML